MSLEENFFVNDLLLDELNERWKKMNQLIAENKKEAVGLAKT